MAETVQILHETGTYAALVAGGSSAPALVDKMFGFATDRNRIVIRNGSDYLQTLMTAIEGTDESVLFLNSSLHLAEDNSNFSYSSTNHRLSINNMQMSTYLYHVGDTDTYYRYPAANQIEVAAADNVMIFMDGDNNRLESRDSNVAHGMTTISATSAYYMRKEATADDGGIEIYGITDNDGTVPLSLFAYAGGVSSAVDTYMAIVAAKADGTGVRAYWTACDADTEEDSALGIDVYSNDAYVEAAVFKYNEIDLKLNTEITGTLDVSSTIELGSSCVMKGQAAGQLAIVGTTTDSATNSSYLEFAESDGTTPLGFVGTTGGSIMYLAANAGASIYLYSYDGVNIEMDAGGAGSKAINFLSAGGNVGSVDSSGNAQFDGQGAFGVAIDSASQFYCLAADAQSTIVTGVNGRTLSDGASNKGVAGTAAGGGGTKNIGVYGNASGLAEAANRHFEDGAGNYSTSATGGSWVDASCTMDKKKSAIILSTIEINALLDNIKLVKPRKMIAQNDSSDREFIGVVLDDPGFPKSAIFRNVDGEIDGYSGAKLAQHNLIVIQRLLERIETLEAK